MDQKTKHTPGPWQAYNLHKGRTLKHWVVDTGTGKVTLDDAAHWEAGNAHLIAAAPAMYEALSHAAVSTHHPSCKCKGEYSANPERYCTCHVQKARTALAQAEGSAK